MPRSTPVLDRILDDLAHDPDTTYTLHLPSDRNTAWALQQALRESR